MVCRNAVSSSFLALLLAAGSASADPVTYTSDVIIDRADSSVTAFTLKAMPESLADLGPRGFSISTFDYEDTSDLVSVGAFRLHRPLGTFLWHFSNSGGAVRPAMELNNDHSLTLKDPNAAGYDIVLTPGLNGGIRFNNIPLVSSVNSQLATLSVTGASQFGSLAVSGATQLQDLNVSGGIVLYGGNITPDIHWATPSFWTGPATLPGLLSAGVDSSAWGENSVALGNNAVARGRNSIAIGPRAYADNGWTENLGIGSIAIGADTVAGNQSMALGGGTHSYQGSVAVGVSANAGGAYTMSLQGSTTSDYYSMASQWSSATKERAYAAAGGEAHGVSSIALGANTYAYKSFAANSGVAWADYSNAVGRGTETRFPYQVALGTYNDPGQTATQTVLLDADPIFVVGNGKINVESNAADDERSNALTVSFNGNTKVQGALTVDGAPRGVATVSTFKRGLKVEGGLTVDGGTTLAPVQTTFTRDVNIQGVLRVTAPAGDIGMGDFTAGPQP